MGKTMKNIFILTLVCCTLYSISAQSFSFTNTTSPFFDDQTHSGVKLSLNTGYAKLIENLDVSKLVNGLVVVSKEIEIKQSILTFKLKKATIGSVKLPSLVTVTNTPGAKQGEASTDVKLKDIEITILVDYEAEVSIIKDKGTNSPLKIVLDEVDAQYHFSNGQFVFDHLTAKIGDIDFKFNNILFKGGWAILKGIIKGQINKLIPKLHTIVETSINKFIHQVIEVKVPVVDLYFNLTSTNTPEINIFDVTAEQTPHAQSFYEPVISSEQVYEVFREIMTNFLEIPQEDVLTKEEATQGYTNASVSPIPNAKLGFLEIGINGYAYIDPTRKPTFPFAVDMKFKDDSYDKGVSLLLSDFTVNSLLFIAQQSGFIRFNIDKNLKIELPFSIDTQGLSVLIPEFADRYGDKKLDVSIKLSVPPLQEIQPTIGTSFENIHVAATFEIEVKVQESDDLFDPPVVVLKTKNVVFINIVPEFVDEKLNVLIHDATIVKVDVTETEFETFDADRFKTQLNNLVEVALDMVKPSLSNIDVLALIEKYIPFQISNLTWDLMDQYNSISFNVAKK